jgi:hypothetical protein
MTPNAVEFVESLIDRHEPEHARKRCQADGAPEDLVTSKAQSQLVGPQDCEAEAAACLLQRSELCLIGSELSSW